MKTKVNWLIAITLFTLVPVLLLIGSIKKEREVAWKLRLLQQSGRQVRATEVHTQETGQGPRELPSYYVRYRFLPLERNEDDEGSKGTDSATFPIVTDQAMKEFLADTPWVWGEARISLDLKRTIEAGNERVITYLPDMPDINTIGQITNERISNEWKSNSDIQIAIIWLGVTPIVLLLTILRKKFFAARRENAG